MKIKWISICLLFIACNNTSDNEHAKTKQSDTASVSTNDTQAAKEKSLNIEYHALPIKKHDSNYKHVINTYTGDSLNIIQQINRIDKKFIRNLDTLIIPSVITGNLLDYTPFPMELPFMKEVNKLFIFAYPIQAYAVYENGRQIKWGASSMGKKSTKTPTGLNYTNWKGRRVISSVNSSWILQYNFNIMNTFGVGWHQYDMPGYPASHSCLRLFMDDAKWLYEYADMWILQNDKVIAKGNPVLVFGDYPWGERRPWYHLIDDPKSNNITLETLKELLEPELPKILEAQQIRADIIEQRKSAVQNQDTLVR